MTMQSWQQAPATLPPLRQEPTYQLQHIRDHLRGMLTASDAGYADAVIETMLDRYMTLVDKLVMPVTVDVVGTKMQAEGQWFTENESVVRALDRISDVLLLPRPAGVHSRTIARMGLLRRVYGIDPCWCEFDL